MNFRLQRVDTIQGEPVHEQISIEYAYYLPLKDCIDKFMCCFVLGISLKERHTYLMNFKTKFE
jgi:hypothetical protein